MSRFSPGVALTLFVCAGAPLIAQQPITPSPGSPQPSTAVPQGNGPQVTSPGNGGQPPSSPAPDDGGRQSSRSRSNGAVFGGADSASRLRPRALDLSLSVSSAYDDDLSEGLGTGWARPVGGEFSDVSATMSFARRAPRARLATKVGGSMRHYPTLDRLVGSTYAAGTDFELSVDRRTTMQASLDGTYVSEFAFDTISRQSGLGNVALVSTGLDATGHDGARISYGGTAGMTRKMGLHSMLSLHAGARKSERRLINELGTEKTMGSYVSHTVGRYTSIGLGYGLHISSQEFGARDARPAWSHDLQAGIDHAWPHSRERRSVLSLSIGPALLRLPLDGGGSRVALVGSAALSHDMSRSWTLRTSYRRAAGSIDGLESDTVSADLHGLLTRRADLTISTGYSRINLGLNTGPGGYTTAFSSGRLQVALGREVALYSEYVLYSYDYDAVTAVPLAGADLFSRRRGVRVGVTLWKPFYGER